MGDDNDTDGWSREETSDAGLAELRHRALMLDTVLDAVVSTDKAWRVTGWNRAAEEMFGWTVEEAIGRQIRDLIPVEYLSATPDEVRSKLTEGPGTWIGVSINTRRDGSTFYVDSRASVIRGEDEQVLGVVAVMRDITRLWEAEEGARRHQATVQGVNLVLREALVCETSADLARIALSVAEELTDSQFGFICEINEAGRFDTIAISDTGWEACRVADGSLVLARDLPIRGIRGRVIQERRSMVFNDPSAHEDWVAPPEGHPPLQSFLGVPLWVGDRIIGEVGLANRESGYRPEDVRAIEALSAAFVEALMRKRAEERVRGSLVEKEVLLKEIHHRVKNNLQVISSLLNLQSRQIQDEAVLELFRESQNRVRSMALTHEQLYRSSDLAEIDLSRYVKDLAGGLVRSYGIDPRRVRLKVEVSDVALPLDVAIPSGLIVTELVSNALKHAFPGGREGEIRIELSETDSGRARLYVADNGVGLPGAVEIESSGSLGLRLLRSLATQLDGSIKATSDNGTTVCIEFEMPPKGDGGTTS